MERQDFKFKIVSSNEPMSNDPFYHWLDKRYNSCKINVVDHEHPEWYYYLTDIGFNADIHVISEESLNILKNIEAHWFRCTPYFEPKSKAELFYSGFHQGEMSGIIGAGFATPELVQMVIDAGWIYNVTAENTYFSVTNDCLFANYQFIIGSRRICKIKD